VPLSERPSLCSSANWERGEVAVGSSDHAVYVVDVATARRKRTLFTRTLGHTECATSRFWPLISAITCSQCMCKGSTLPCPPHRP
jgi:hypothetical protein